MQHRTIARAALLACAATTGALAQPGPHDGRWTARFEAFGQPRQAVIEIQGQGGSWLMQYLPTSADVCFRLKAPIEVLEVSAEKISFVPRRSKALAGCVDGALVTLKRTSDKLLEGSFPDGRPIRLER